MVLYTHIIQNTEYKCKTSSIDVLSENINLLLCIGIIIKYGTELPQLSKEMLKRLGLRNANETDQEF
jgi:hypothetical protein